MQKSGSASWLGLALLTLWSTVPAAGGTIYGFEPDSGTVPTYPGMTPDGWYTPTVSGTGAAAVYSYAAIAGYGIAADHGGGNNALVLAQAADGTSRKAQTNVNFAAAPIWTISYDLSLVNLSSSGNTYATDWIGSFAPQSTTGNFSSFFVLNGWDNDSANSTWSAFYYVYDSSGDPLDDDGVSPGLAWTGMSQNHWYTESTTFDTATNEILSVSITDLTADSTTTVEPTGWYMYGGSTPVAGLDSIRLRGYGGTNAMLIDNVALASDSVPEPATFPLLAAALAALTVMRRRVRRDR